MSNNTPGHITAAHVQPHASHYNVHFPEHGTRQDDPYYREFDAFRKRAKKDPSLYVCVVGSRRGDFSDCTLDKPLELHHAHIEWALQNEIDLDMVRKQYPEITDTNELGHWIESDQNLVFLCQFHHRGHGGAHVASASDFEGQHFVKHLID
jgi:hypothetical protein